MGGGIFLSLGRQKVRVERLELAFPRMVFEREREGGRAGMPTDFIRSRDKVLYDKELHGRVEVNVNR